jgi:uncharacterized protein YjiS (DUF1127 family)
MAQTLTASPGNRSSVTRSSTALRLPPAASWLALLRTWRRRMDEKRQLMQFDARELQDAGMTGADRAAILATPFWRDTDRRR